MDKISRASNYSQLFDRGMAITIHHTLEQGMMPGMIICQPAVEAFG